MDTVPTLCATGTVGIAAVGYALGRPQIPPTVRPTFHKRRALASGFHTGPYTSTDRPTSATPSEPSRPGLGPSFKSGFLRRPKSSSFPHKNPPFETSRLSKGDLGETGDWRSSIFGGREETNIDQKPYEYDLTGTGSGTARLSWLRRMSTFTSESHTSTPRPSTPSMSFSNTSNAPILSTTTKRTPTTTRNKLVKRASSYRALQSDHANFQTFPKSQVPTLRRPATSHQRSATFRTQYPQEFEAYEEAPSISRVKALDQHRHGKDSSMHVYYPLFRSRPSKSTKEMSSRKRDSIGGTTSHRESIRCISAVREDLPTLLMATSIYPDPAEEAVGGSTTQLDHRSPSIGLQTPPSFSTQLLPQSTPSNDHDHRPRRSFSIGDLFSSPSPSTRKLTRSGSLRRKKDSGNRNGSKRVSSAPLPLKGRRTERRGNSEVETNLQIDLSLSSSNDSLRHRQSTEFKMRSPSSPLPPLDRLSVFEIDLADTAPSYSTNSQSNTVSSPSFPTSPTPVTQQTNGPKRIPSKGKPYRPSGVYSDRASTLVGSDNENSRLFGGDGDEMDCRSETIYDSIRTGATGSSHSGARGPRIETVFDASPPPELLKQNLAALQDSLSNDAFAHLNKHGSIIAEEEESIHTPIKFRRSLEDDFPTPSKKGSRTYSSPRLPSPLPSVHLVSRQSQDGKFRFTDSQIDGIWASDDAESISWDDEDLEEVRINPETPSLFPSIPDIHMEAQEEIMFHEPPNRQDRPKSNIFEWSERSHTDREAQQGSSPRPKTVHGKQNPERGSRSAGRRGPSALHLRSQSVPLPPDGLTHRGVNSTSKLDAWLLGNKGVSEEWDGDFDFEEPVQTPGLHSDVEDPKQLAGSNLIVVPQAILERQASVHGQFGQVKELTLLVEELKRLRHQANAQGIMGGQSAELWKEAEGIINLATLDDEEHEFIVPRSPHSPGLDFDPFEDDSPTSQRHRRSGLSPPNDSLPAKNDHSTTTQVSSHPSPANSKFGTPTGRPRKESVATAKSVLENIHHHRSSYGSPLLNARSSQKKLPFDTTSLRDLVTRAGVVTRALKEIVRRAQNTPQTPERRPGTPPDPPFSQMFHQPASSPAMNKNPRMVKSTSSNSFLGGSISANNDNEINGRMKMMMVV